MRKYLVSFLTRHSSRLALEIYAYTQYDAQKEVISRHPDAFGFIFEDLTQKEEACREEQKRTEEQRRNDERRQQYKNTSNHSSSSDEAGFFESVGNLIKLALFIIAAIIAIKIVLFIIVVWEFLLYIVAMCGLAILIYKLEDNAKKVSITVSAIAIPIMIFRMTHLVDNYKEYYANEEKMRLEKQLQEAEQKNKESNGATKNSSTHKKTVSIEPKSIKNTQTNPSESQKETEQTIEDSPEPNNVDNTAPTIVDHTSEPSVLFQSTEITN